MNKKTWAALILLSLAGQMAWAIENNWFNTFVYAEIAPDPRIVSWMVMASALVSTIVTIIVGATSDRWSGRWGKRKPFIFAGYILWGLTTILFPSAAAIKQVGIAGITVILFDAIMSGFGSIGNDAALNAYITDITNTSNRGKVQGVLQVVMWVAFLITGMVAGFVVDNIGYYNFFYIIGGIVILIGLVAGGPMMQEAPVARPTVKRESVWREIGRTMQVKSLKENRELLIVFISIATWGLGGQIFSPYLLIYMIHYLGFSAGEAGMLQGIALLVGGILFSVPLGFLSDRWGRRKTGMAMILFQSVALVAFALFAKTQLTAAIFTSLLFIPLTGWFINYKSWTRDLFPEDKRGQFSGFTLLFSILIPMATGPFIGAWLTNTYGMATVIENEAGFVPTPLLFEVSAAVVLLALIPLFFTKEMKATGRITHAAKEVEEAPAVIGS